MLDRYIKMRPGSSFWQLRVPVPKDVQSAFGRREFTRTLDERDWQKAVEAALPILAELTAQWAELRTEAKLQIVARVPTDDQLLALAGELFKSARQISRQGRREIEPDPDAYEEYIAAQERRQIELIRAIEVGNLDAWIEPAERVLRNRGFAVNRESNWFRGFLEHVAEVTVAAIDVSNRRARGELSARPSSDVVRRAEDLAARAETGSRDLLFSDLSIAFMRQWVAAKSGTKQTNTEQQKEATFRLFAGFFADRTIRQVRQEDAATFRDALSLFDPNWARSPRARNMSWAELLATFGNRPRGLADQTMNRHMRVLQELWTWSHKRGHCEGDNPFAGFNRKLRRGVNVDPYVAWEVDELRTLFDPPPRRTDLTEIMIVAMFSGMRLDEIASMTWGRVRVSDEGGHRITYFQIDDAKTPAGVRQVPLHPSLAWLAGRERGKPDDRLWPNWNDEGVGKKPGADAGRAFSTFKLSRGFRDRRKVFHSFRKNVTRFMERAGVPENEWAQVFGHERGFTYSVYNPDGITLARKAAIITEIDYPDLDIPHPGGEAIDG